MTVACSMASFGSSARVRHGATCQRPMVPAPLCYNRFVRWRKAGVWDQIMDALSAGHDPAVQMIDTSVVRVHQHGADTTSSQPTIWRSSNSHQSESGYVLMSPRPSPLPWLRSGTVFTPISPRARAWQARAARQRERRPFAVASRPSLSNHSPSG